MSCPGISFYRLHHLSVVFHWGLSETHSKTCLLWERRLLKIQAIVRGSCIRILLPGGGHPSRNAAGLPDSDLPSLPTKDVGLILQNGSIGCGLAWTGSGPWTCSFAEQTSPVVQHPPSPATTWQRGCNLIFLSPCDPRRPHHMPIWSEQAQASLVGGQAKYGDMSWWLRPLAGTEVL